MRKLITLAVCLLGIGTSHAGLVVDRGVDRIRDEARASFAREIGWRATDLRVSGNLLTQWRRTGSTPLSNYGTIKREYIKYSWNPGALGETAGTEQAVSVTEPGTLALLALGLIGIGLARRRKPR